MDGVGAKCIGPLPDLKRQIGQGNDDGKATDEFSEIPEDVENCLSPAA